MRILKIGGTVAGVAMIGYVLLAAISPARLEIELSQKIFAQPRAVFAHVACLNEWPSWSVWGKLDPSVLDAFSYKACGVGAWQKWEGRQVGNGKRTIIDLNPDAYLKMDVEFEGGDLLGQSEWFFNPSGSATEVVWKFSGSETSFLGRPLNFAREGILREIYGKSLQALKRESEKEPSESLPYYEYLVQVEETSLPDQGYLMEVSEIENSDLERFLRKGDSGLKEFVEQHRIEVSGPKTIMMLGQQGSRMTIANALPVSDDIKNTGPFVYRRMVGGRAFQAKFNNTQDGFVAMKYAADAVNLYTKDHGFSPIPPIRVVIDEERVPNDPLQWSGRIIFQVSGQE